MSTDLAPSFIMRVLSGLSYFQKFLLISLLFALSIAVPAYFMIHAQNERINSAELELQGTEYERTLRHLLEALLEHKIFINRYLNHNIGDKEQLLSIQKKINIGFQRLATLNPSLQNAIRTNLENLQEWQLTDLEPKEIKQKWEELIKRIYVANPAITVSEQEQIIANIRSLFLHVGETSEQMIDPAIRLNYLIDLNIASIPRSQQLLSQIIVLGENLLHSKEEAPSRKVDLIILLALLEDNLNTIKILVPRALNAVHPPSDNSEVESKLREPARQYIDGVQEFITLTKEWALQPSKEANAADYFALGSKSLANSFVLWDAIIDQIDHILVKRINTYKMHRSLSLAALLLCASIGFLLGYLVMRAISIPLTKLVNAAKHLASGDLSTRVPIAYEDEVGQVGIAFNQMAKSFQELIGQLQWTGIQLTTSTTEIATAAKQQEATIAQQEATTKEIVNTARDISSTSKEFAKTMNDVSTSAEQTSSLAASGKAGLNRMETIMHQMVDASQNIASKLAVLNEKAGNITSVITTITKVADQTNLLSLNAAIEAEKAGEHGRSFSVIAREIRRLADQTANATLDIEKMVNEMVAAVSAGVIGVDKFSDEIQSGVNQVAMVSEQLSKIIEQVQQQTKSFEDVNQGMQGQSQGAEKIKVSIVALSEAAQKTTESIRQFHNAIEQLNNAAQNMQIAVSKIKR